MKRGTAAKVILGKNTLVDVPAGVVHGTDVILGGKAGLLNDFGGLVLSNNLMLGRKISRSRTTTVTVRGQSPLNLPDAIANSLSYVKAFGGTELRPLPDGYTKLEYIKSSGTQLLNTGITSSSNLKLEMVVDRPTPPPSGTVWRPFGSTPDATNGNYTVFESSGSTPNYIAILYGKVSTSTLRGNTTTSYNKSKFILDAGVLTFDNGQTLLSNHASDVFDTNNEISLFGSYNLPSQAEVTIYYCKLWKSGVLVRNFIPAKNSSGVVGMYDTVSGQFFTNAGTGDFIAGAPVDPILPDNYIRRQFIYMLDGSYLLTDIVPASNYKVEMDFQTTNVTTAAEYYLGVRDVPSGVEGLAVVKRPSSAGGTLGFDGFQANNRYSSTYVPISNTRYKYTYDNGTITLTIDNTVVASHTFTPDSTVTSKLAINGFNDNGAVAASPTGIYLYSFRVWNAQGELVADYVPAVEKATVPVVGFYDTVSGTFKTATAGTFAAGPEYILVPSPDTPMNIISNNGVLKVKDSELPVGYKRLVGITYDSNTYYETNEKLYGTDTLTIRVSSAGTSGRNLVGAYSGTDDDVRNFSLYLVGGSSSNSYLRRGTQLTRPRCGGTSSTRTLVIGPTGTSGFATNVTYDEETFETTDTFWIGALPNSSSTKYDGNIVGNITVSNRLKYIPCERVSDGEIGYYETFTGVFLENQDTGTPVSMGYDTSYMTKAYAVGTVETINMHGKNLFDKDSATVLNLSGTSTNPLAYRADRYGVYIPVEPSTTYTISRADTLYLNLFETAFVPAVGVATTQYTAMGTASTQTITTAATTRYLYIFAAGTDFISSLQIEKGSTATDYAPYYDGGTATAEVLLKVGDYQDEQEILSGVVTRKVGVRILDGTEDWISVSGDHITSLRSFLGMDNAVAYSKLITTITGDSASNCCVVDGAYVFFYYDWASLGVTTKEEAKQWFLAQYNAGTPVIIVYPLATATTESVAVQTLQVIAGDNVLEITQASLRNLELEAQYKAAVQLTIQEVEDANLDNNVEVTIS